MPVRPMFSNRGVPANAKGKRHLKAVNPANERQRNPEEQAIPWKTIIATTIVTSIVSTAAVSFARFLFDRAKERKERLFGQAQQAQAQAQQQAALPQRAESSYPMLMHQGGQHSMPMLPQLNFQPNPFALNSVQRPLSLPQAPHVNPSNDSAEPSWFQEFREDFDKRIQNIEAAQVRPSERAPERERGHR